MERTAKRPSAGNHAPGGQLGHLGRELSPARALGPAVIHHAHHLLRRDRVSGRNREGGGKLRCRRSCHVRASHHPLRQAECRPRDERRDQGPLGYTRTTPKPSKNYKVQETTRTSTTMISISPGLSSTPSKNSAWWAGNMSTSSGCAGSGALLSCGMCTQVSSSSQCV